MLDMVQVVSLQNHKVETPLFQNAVACLIMIKHHSWNSVFFPAFPDFNHPSKSTILVHDWNNIPNVDYGMEFHCLMVNRKFQVVSIDILVRLHVHTILPNKKSRIYFKGALLPYVLNLSGLQIVNS